MSTDEWMNAIKLEQARIAWRPAEPTSDLVEMKCRCGAVAMLSPGSSEVALCMDCRRSDCGIDWPWFEPIGQWHPTVGYASPGLNDYAPPVENAEPYPAPAVTSRQESAFPIPAPVMKLAEFARENGWDVRTQYAQGNAPHGSTGRPTALRDSIALVFGNHSMTDRQAYACYEKAAAGSAWSWDGILIWGPDLPPYGGCGVAELKEFLSEPCTETVPLLAWVEMIRKAAAKGAALQKRRDAMRKEIRSLSLAGESLSRICEHAAEIYDRSEVEKILATRSKKAEKETAR